MISKMPVKNTKSKPKTTTGKTSVNKYLAKVTALKSFRPNKHFYVVLAVIGILALAVYQKSWFVAAMVNNQPVSNLDLQSRLNQQFRQQTLSQMINEKIILDEARKNKIIVTDGEINSKISQLEVNVGGAKMLDSLLSQQNQTRDSLKNQIKLQLIIEKLYGQEATISAEEVSQFIDQNKDQLQATTSAEQTKETTEILKQQKISRTFSNKFQELRNQAKIQIF